MRIYYYILGIYFGFWTSVESNHMIRTNVSHTITSMAYRSKELLFKNFGARDNAVLSVFYCTKLDVSSDGSSRVDILRYSIQAIRAWRVLEKARMFKVEL